MQAQQVPVSYSGFPVRNLTRNLGGDGEINALNSYTLIKNHDHLTMMLVHVCTLL